MKLNKFFIFILLCGHYINSCAMQVNSIASSYNYDNKSQASVYLYENNCPQDALNLKSLLDRFEIQYQTVSTIDITNTTNLYLICNVHGLAFEQLPKNYIVYQTRDISNINLSAMDLKKLSLATCVWDNSRENINTYKHAIHSYQYLPSEYEFVDPVILPCMLDVQYLPAYKEILRYSNSINTDISSHLPAIFVHTVLQKPNTIVEVGVRGGESTLSFAPAAEFVHANLIGIDLDPACHPVYTKVKNSTFLCIDDLQFASIFKANNQLKNHILDVIFIDTSHLYSHTMGEITQFLSVLSHRGFLMFHDSNMSPLPGFTWTHLNGVVGARGWDNQKGVIRAIKNSFNINFDESQYANFEFTHDSNNYRIIHYPFCNGLTIIRRI